jgi:hypothetical protein
MMHEGEGRGEGRWEERRSGRVKMRGGEGRGRADHGILLDAGEHVHNNHKKEEGFAPSLSSATRDGKGGSAAERGEEGGSGRAKHHGEERDEVGWHPDTF